MKHISKVDGKEYEITLSICPEDGKSYDITTIFKFASDEEDEIYENGGEHVDPVLIDWYFGKYDFDFTEEYIQAYIDRGGKPQWTILQ